MEMVVHLNPEIFDIVKTGSKNIEVRINDEKRRQLKVGDTLVFLKRPDDNEEIRAIVTSLDYYDNFNELVNHYEMERLYLSSYSKEMFLDELAKFYTLEEQEKYGVVAIGFKKQ